MIAQVVIDEDGAVTVIVDSDEADTEAAVLKGLVLDDMLDRASRTAIATWFEIRDLPDTEAGE